MTELEIKNRYKHFSERKIPFEDEIVEIIPNDKIPYYDREEWLKNLFFVFKKGYYIRYKDFYAANTHHEKSDEQPFAIFLDGILKIAYVYAYNSQVESTIHLILKILSEGNICVTKYISGEHFGKYNFCFSLPYYSWISREEKENN